MAGDEDIERFIAEQKAKLSRDRGQLDTSRVRIV